MITTTTGAATPKLVAFIKAVFEAKKVTLKVDMTTRLTYHPRILEHSHPRLRQAELYTAAVLGYLARTVEGDKHVFTVTALGRQTAKIAAPPRETVYRAGACPRCGSPNAEHWVPQGETGREVGFWLCDETDDGQYS